MIKFDELTALGSLTYRTTLGEHAAKIDARSARLRRETIRVTAVDVKAQIVQAMTVAVAQVTTAERRLSRPASRWRKNLAVNSPAHPRPVAQSTCFDGRRRAAQLRAGGSSTAPAATAIGADRSAP
jgi:hypothetical protein